MQRRHFLSSVAVASSALALSACGFRLRGATSYPFKSLFLKADTQSPFARQLQRTLEGSGITILRAPSNPELAERVLELLGEQHERAVISQTATGGVRELQLRLRIRYRLSSNVGMPNGDVVELLQTRDLSYDESAALAKEAEEQLLFTDMQNDLIAQIVRRIAAAQPTVGK